jgi:DNA-binding NtrC family response regulator
MKRILVIDESEVVRETLALILGREFAVLKRPLVSRGFPLADTREDVDLLIFGVTPRLGAEMAGLLRFAAQLPFAVLFLVESKAIARTIEDKAEIGCLAKPFNPYELHEKVGQLLARRAVFSETGYVVPPNEFNDFSRYLDFPYLSRSVALLVRRFAATRLPLLITGELGCGQDRVAGGICSLDSDSRPPLSINAAEVCEKYLDQLNVRLSLQASFKEFPSAFLIKDLHSCSLTAQSLLLNFLQESGGKAEEVRCLSTANAELLQQVYRGEFLEALYYKLATLTLRLSPLRERPNDIPVMAEWLAGEYARKLGLAEPRFSQDARQRLCNYLWFGNASELETVIARTLSFHRKSYIDADDLIFDFSGDPQPNAQGAVADSVPGDARCFERREPVLEVYMAEPAARAGADAKTADLNVVIHELAHELKNPMVTIKTFAQLLGERYQDEDFRSRFQEVVGDDIERMDDLLEMMLEFADFAAPRLSKVTLENKLRTALTAVHDECAKRQIRIEWKERRGWPREIETDESQLEYILTNVLFVAASEAKLGSEIELDVSTHGALVIRYVREGARVASISHYLSDPSSRGNENTFSLRVLLAKHLLERNGGQFTMGPSNGEKEILKLEFPIAGRRNEN